MPESNTNSTVFVIPAMDCPEELRLIEKGLRSLDGIDGLRPDYLNRSLRVDFDQSRVGVEAIADQLHRIGFTPSNAQFDQADPRANWLQFSPIRLTTIGGALLLLAAGLLSAAVYYWSWPYFPWVPFLAIASTVLSGWHVAVAAWRAVALRHLNMHVLMCIAASGAIAIGEWFEAATAMLLFGVSLWLEEFSRGRARKAVESLVALMPKMAHRVGTEHACGHEHREGHECEHVVADIPLDAVRMGDRILIKPGERVPVDGTVLDGASAVNQAPLTGESVPVDKSTGDELYAGSLNGEGSLQMRATSTSADSSMAQISRLVEQAQAAKSPTERFVDQFARWYTPAVIGLAFGIAFIPLLLGWKADANVGATWYHDAREWISRGLVMLVVACPCALVISTPVTILCGLRRATRWGILIKGGEFLEGVGRVRCLAIDKTGTLTVGEPRVVEIKAVGGAGEDRVLALAAALEAFSEHPLASAIVQAAQDRGLELPAAAQVTGLPGFGVKGVVEGQGCVVANAKYFLQNGAKREQLRKLETGADGYSVAVVRWQDRFLGSILLTDEPRSDAQTAIQQWRRLRISPIVMLTGDRESVASRVASLVGIDHVRAGLLPTQKIDIVRQLADSHRHLAMVGDGINDAPALAAAPIGIALGAKASDTALETADIVILSPHLVRVTQLLELGRRTRHRLTENILLAIFIKALVLVLASIGWGTMGMAVAADVGASMLVIFNGMRLLSEGNVPA